MVLGYSLIGVVAGLAIGSVLVFFIAVLILVNQTTIRPDPSPYSRSEVVGFFDYSVPLTLKDVGKLLYERVDILMVGFLLAEADVGIYQIAFFLAAFIALPLGAINQLVPPVASGLYSNGSIEELGSVYKTVTRWTVTISVFLALVLGVYGAEILALFGPQFPAGAAVLAVLLVGQLTNNVVGPNGFLLMRTDHQYVNLVNQWTLGILNIILNYFFILEFGLIGEAIATASVLTLINIVRLIEVWYLEGLVPYSISFWKPLAAGGITGGLMATLTMLFSGYHLLIIGGLIGVLVYGLCLFVVGFEEQDRALFDSMVLNRLRD